MNSAYLNGFKAAQYKTYDEHADELHTVASKKEYLEGAKDSGLLNLAIAGTAVVASYLLDFPSDTTIGYISAVEAGLRILSAGRPIVSARMPVGGPTEGIVGVTREILQKVTNKNSIDDVVSEKPSPTDVLNL